MLQSHDVTTAQLMNANIKLGITSDINQERDIVFVYCPPKVGSTTLVSSIRLFASDKFYVLHVHDEVMLSVLAQINDISVNDIIQYNVNLGKRIYVLDVYREPIERKMSEYFEELGALHFNNSDQALCEYSMQKLTRRFNRIFPHIGNDDYFMERYGIPTSSMPAFDHSRKYLRINYNGATYIKLRLKDSNIWGEILSEIFSVSVTIVKDYETKNKVLGDLYARFIQTYKIPTNLLNMIDERRYMQRYYTEEENLQYLHKWSLKTTDECDYYSVSEYELYKDISLDNSVYKNIQYDHYIDNGCMCTGCKSQRELLVKSVKRGDKPMRKIVHGLINLTGDGALNKRTVNKSVSHTNPKTTHKGNEIKRISQMLPSHQKNNILPMGGIVYNKNRGNKNAGIIKGTMNILGKRVK